MKFAKKEEESNLKGAHSLIEIKCQKEIFNQSA